jgi:hypothetical protein
MHTRTLGQNFQVSAIGLGCMGMSQSYGPNPASSLRRTLLAEAQPVRCAGHPPAARGSARHPLGYAAE